MPDRTLIRHAHVVSLDPAVGDRPDASSARLLPHAGVACGHAR